MAAQRGRHRTATYLTREQRQAAVEYALRPGKSVAKAAAKFNVHTRTIERLLKLFNETGEVERSRVPVMTEALKDRLIQHTGLLAAEPAKGAPHLLLARYGHSDAPLVLLQDGEPPTERIHEDFYGCLLFFDGENA